LKWHKKYVARDPLIVSREDPGTASQELAKQREKYAKTAKREPNEETKEIIKIMIQEKNRRNW
jgi:hypothetical protein